MYGHLGWTWAKTGEEAITFLATGKVTMASLDHDLAPEHYPHALVTDNKHTPMTGYDVVCWMEEHNVWPPGGVTVHSMNPVGRARMQQVIDRHYQSGAVW